MQKNQNTDKSNFSLDGLVDLFGGLMNKVGTIGFIVIVGIIFLIKFPDESQKKEIINTWILFKNPMGINILIGFNFILFVTLIFHNFHYKNRIGILTERIDIMADEKKALQEELLKRNLNSSKKSR